MKNRASRVSGLLPPRPGSDPAATRRAGARGTNIYYIVTCYGMPLVINTNLVGKQGEGPIRQPTDLNVPNRALTGWLVNIEDNFEVGFDRVTGRPGARCGTAPAPGSKALGTTVSD